jgi:hypothetical protein
MRILFSSDTPFFIARLRADIERIIEFLLENKPAISWAETGWSF